MTKPRIYYESSLKEKARYLRNNSTLSEILLWNYLKGKQMLGHDFHRQKPILKFIVDFFCYDLMLAIEIDGKSHDHEDAVNYDNNRQKSIEKIGITFLRFDDLEVKKDMNNVLRTIQYFIEEHEEKHPAFAGRQAPQPSFKEGVTTANTPL
jgi:very-short-patch-repair endonuclease